MEYIQYIVIILSLLKNDYYASKVRRETLCVIASLLIKFPALSKAASKESTLFTHELRSWSGAVSEEEEALEPSFSFPGEALLLLTFLKVAMPFGRSIFAWTFSSRRISTSCLGFVHG